MSVGGYVIVEVLVVLNCQRWQNKRKEGAVLHNDRIFNIGVDVLPVGVIHKSDDFAGRVHGTTLSSRVLCPAFVLQCNGVVVLNHCRERVWHVENQI